MDQPEGLLQILYIWELEVQADGAPDNAAILISYIFLYCMFRFFNDIGEQLREFVAVLRIRIQIRLSETQIRILLSSSKNYEKNLDFFM